MECVISTHFGVSEAFAHRYVDIETRELSFEEVARWLEECRIVVVDETSGTIRVYGERMRARRQLILSVDDDLGAPISFPPLVRSAFMYAIGGKANVDLTRKCCMCYTITFTLGFCAGLGGFGYCLIGMMASEPNLATLRVL